MRYYWQEEKDLNSFIELLTGPMKMVFITIFVVLLAIGLVFLIGKIILFKKCGQKWWQAIIPFYGTYIFIVKISGLHWIFFVLAETIYFGLYGGVLITIVYAMAYYNLAKKCHQDEAATAIFGAIFSGIVTAVYGYNPKITYDANEKVDKCSFFGSIIK